MTDQELVLAAKSELELTTVSGKSWVAGGRKPGHYPNASVGAAVSWQVSGTKPNRIVTWPDAANIHGQIVEADHQYVTRA